MIVDKYKRISHTHHQFKLYFKTCEITSSMLSILDMPKSPYLVIIIVSLTTDEIL